MCNSWPVLAVLMRIVMRSIFLDIAHTDTHTSRPNDNTFCPMKKLWYKQFHYVISVELIYLFVCLFVFFFPLFMICFALFIFHLFTCAGVLIGFVQFFFAIVWMYFSCYYNWLSHCRWHLNGEFEMWTSALITIKYFTLVPQNWLGFICTIGIYVLNKFGCFSVCTFIWNDVAQHNVQTIVRWMYLMV